MSISARQIIKKEYGKSRNIMTPNVIRYGKISKNIAYELSSGRGIVNEQIYGVSVVEIDENGETIRRTDLSKMFYSLEESEDYIKKISLN